MRTTGEMTDELQVALGLEPADLVLTGARVALVHSEEMMEACIYIKNGRIAALRESHLLSARRTMDCGGRFVIPGLIDAHMHVEPTLLTPEALAELIVPLPIGGLLSNLGAQEVIERVDELNAAAEALGCTLPAPFMTLSFITLPTVPELGLTDKGLIDVKSHSVIPVLI